MGWTQTVSVCGCVGWTMLSEIGSGIAGADCTMVSGAEAGAGAGAGCTKVTGAGAGAGADAGCT
jgi:hypothetical protein